MKIIITDLQTRKSFDIYNIYKGFKDSIVGTSDGNLLERFILSFIYLSKISKLGNKYFSNDFKNIVKDSSENYLFFPTEEKTILNFYDYIKNNKSKNIFFTLPKQTSFECVRNKKHFSQFCIKHNLPVPTEYQYEQLLTLEDIPCNLILKPKIGSGSMGIRFIDSFEDLLACNDEIDFENYLIQERIENSKDIEGAFFLFHKSRLISYYGHRRIRTYPPEGGVSVYSKCEVNEELKKLGVELLEKLEWSGIAMVEFLYDVRTKSYKIIEVNPRAWGSIMLSEFCGSNMLQNYKKISIGEKPIDLKINDKRYIRWFFPWDVISYIKKRGAIKDFWKFNRDNTCFINFTYSSWYRSIMFLIYNIFNPQTVLKLFKKVFRL